MTKIKVKPGQSLADAIEDSRHERLMEIATEAALAFAKAVEAARLDERERCAKIADGYDQSPPGEPSTARA